MLDRVVAIVNQEVITWSELHKSMEADASPQLKELKDEEKRKIFRENEASYLETLINLTLQLQEARSLGLIVTEDETNEAIENIKKKYALTDASFRESMSKEGYSIDDYRKRLHDQILLSKVVNQQIRSKVMVTDADVTKFLQENKDSLNDSEGYRISQIFLKKTKSVDDKNILEVRAINILGELKQGISFSDLARKYSEDPSSSSGGDLGFIKKNQLMKEFNEAIMKLNVGDVSAPFWTDRGLHIIRLDDKIAPRDQNEIREDAKKNLSNKIFMEKYNMWIKSLREKSYIEIRL